MTTSPLLDTATAALIEEHVRRLLSIMNFPEAKVSCSAPDPTHLHIQVDAGDIGSLLIGPQGAHLMAFQQVIRCLLRRQLAADVRVMVDVNGYRLRRERSLLGLAEEVARKATNTGQSVVMEPMSAAERRTIHTALAGNSEVKTESLGEEPNRRVVVRPVLI